MAETLTFALVPSPGKRVRFDALEAAIHEMRGLLRDVDRSVFRSEGVVRQRQWYVRRLSSSNPTVVLEADEETAPLEHRTNQTVFDGIQGIVQGDSTAPPPFFSDQELQGLLDIRRRVLAKGLDRIDVGTDDRADTVPIAPSIEERVNRILRGTVVALGSLDGELDAINTRKQPYFTMWETMSSQAVRVSFGSDKIDEVKGLLHRSVRVSGLVSYFSNGRPRSISRMEMIKPLATSSGTDRDYWGSVPRLRTLEDTAELLRRGFGDR